MRDGSSGSALGEFERIYRGNVGAVTSYFARRCTDPQTVADLTSETIVAQPLGLAALISAEAPHARGCWGSPGTSTPSTARTRPMAGMRPPGWLGSPSFRLMRSMS